MEKSYNIEIIEQSTKDIEGCMERLNESAMEHEFFEVKGDGECGPLIEKYVNECGFNVDLFIVGTRNQSARMLAMAGMDVK